MAKGRGSNRSKSKPSAKVEDLKAKKNPKGGAVDMFSKVDVQYQTIKLGDGSVAPNPTLNFTNTTFKK